LPGGTRWRGNGRTAKRELVSRSERILQEFIDKFGKALQISLGPSTT